MRASAVQRQLLAQTISWRCTRTDSGCLVVESCHASCSSPPCHIEADDDASGGRHLCLYAYTACRGLIDIACAAQEEVELAAEIAAGAEPIPGTPLPPEPTLDEVLEEGLSRLQDKPTWKLWNWPLDGEVFYDADSFRYCP